MRLMGRIAVRRRGWWVSVLITAGVVLGVMSWLSGQRIRSTGLELLGKSRLYIARAAGEPITTTWTLQSCRNVTFVIKVRENGQSRTKPLTVALGPASWAVEYRQGGSVIYRETWLAGDGTGPAADFADMKRVGTFQEPSQFSRPGQEYTPDVNFGVGTNCGASAHFSSINTFCNQFGCSGEDVTLLTLGDYGAVAPGAISIQPGGPGLPPQVSVPIARAWVSSTPVGWTVTGGAP